MSSDETSHQKILAFLSGEFNKKEERQCLRVELEYAPPGFRPDLLRQWIRTEHPQYFEELTFIEQLVAQIVEIAETDADSAGVGGLRCYVVRTHQQVGTRLTCKFSVAPSFNSSDQALVPIGGVMPAVGGGGGVGTNDLQAMAIVSSNNRDLMRVNQSMYRDTFGTLANLSGEMRDENVKLRAENIVLRRELEEVKSGKEEKELEQMIRVQKNEQYKELTNGVMNIAKSIAARVMAGDTSKGGDPAPVLMLLADFTKSLTQDQIAKMFGVMRQDQHVMLISLFEMAVPKPSGAPSGSPPSGS